MRVCMNYVYEYINMLANWGRQLHVETFLTSPSFDPAEKTLGYIVTCVSTLQMDISARL